MILPIVGLEKACILFVLMVVLVAGICAFPILLKSPLQNAHADGLSFESLPPSMIAGRPISLFIKIDPQILNPESAGNASLQLRIFDSSNNETIQHVTYGVHVIKDYKDLMILSFHSHRGPLKLNILPTEGPITVLNGEWEQTYSSWVSKTGSVDGILDVQAPMLLDSGLYHFQITVLGMTDDQNFLDPDLAPTFDSWLSMGESFQTKIQYNNEDHDVTIISYYDKLGEFSYDPTTFTIFWSMPFDWNLERIQSPNNNMFVHEEVRVPKSFISFLNSTSFIPTVNKIPLTGLAVAVDPYSSETEYIVHYLINKVAIIQLAQIHNQQSNTSSVNENLMSFSLSISTNKRTHEQTSTQIVTTAGIRVLMSWQPSQLASNSQSKLSINFSDGQNVAGSSGDTQLNADVRYDLIVLDKNATKVAEKNNLVAVNGTDVQAISFPADDTYEIVVNITGINRQGETLDESRNGIATGIVVIPEYPSGFTPIIVASGLAVIMLLGGLPALSLRRTD